MDKVILALLAAVIVAMTAISVFYPNLMNGWVAIPLHSAVLATFVCLWRKVGMAPSKRYFVPHMGFITRRDIDRHVLHLANTNYPRYVEVELDTEVSKILYNGLQIHGFVEILDANFDIRLPDMAATSKTFREFADSVEHQLQIGG